MQKGCNAVYINRGLFIALRGEPLRKVGVVLKARCTGPFNLPPPHPAPRSVRRAMAPPALARESRALVICTVCDHRRVYHSLSLRVYHSVSVTSWPSPASPPLPPTFVHFCHVRLPPSTPPPRPPPPIQPRRGRYECCCFGSIWTYQRTRELISARKTSHKHNNNKDLSRLG